MQFIQEKLTINFDKNPLKHGKYFLVYPHFQHALNNEKAEVIYLYFYVMSKIVNNYK